MDVRVAEAPVLAQLQLVADVVTEDDLAGVPLTDELRDPDRDVPIGVRAEEAAGAARCAEPVELDRHSGGEDPAPELQIERHAVAVAHDHPPEVDPLLGDDPEDGELLLADAADVEADRRPGEAGGASGGAHHAQLDVDQRSAVDPDLAKDPGADAGAPDPLDDVPDHHLGHLLDGRRREAGRVVGLLVPARAHDDVQVGGVAEPEEGDRVATEQDARLLDDRPATELLVRQRLGDGVVEAAEEVVVRAPVAGADRGKVVEPQRLERELGVGGRLRAL